MRLRARRPSRRALAGVAAALIVAGLLLGGLTQLGVRTDMGSLLPSDDPALASYEQVSRSFGGDPIVVLVHGSGPGQQLDAGHIGPLLGLEGRLAKLPDVDTVYGPATMLNRIAGQAQDLLAELSGRRDSVRDSVTDNAARQGMDQRHAQRAGDEAAEQFDTRYGSLLVQALPAGLPTLHNQGFIKAATVDGQGRPRPQWRFVMPDKDSVAVLVRPRQGLDETAMGRLTGEVRTAVADARLDARDTEISGVPVVISALGDTVRGELPLIGGIAVLAVSACFLLIPWAPSWRRRLLPVVTTVLAVGLTVAAFGWLHHPLSLGVAAFLPVLLGIGSFYPTYYAQRASRRVVLSVVSATAASFATLSLSALPFVRDLGAAMAIGVLIAAGTGLVLTRRPDGGLAPANPTPRAVSPAPARSWKARAGALTAAAAVAVTGWALLPSLRLEGSLDKLAAGLPEMSSARGVESTIGSSGEVDIALSGGDALSPAAINWAQQAQNVALLRHGDLLRPVVTPSTLLPFLGPDPTGQEIQAGVRMLPPYLAGAVFRDDNKLSLLSFGTKLDDVDKLHRLRDDLHTSLPPPPPGFHVDVTGLPMAAVRGNELLSADRVLSNVAGIFAAGAVLALGLRRRSDAARAVLAAAVATGAGLCLLGTLGLPLSPITVSLGSLTAAVGCEFTVVLSEAVRHRSRAMARSVLLAALSSAVGYAVLAVSGLVAIREFGLLLAVSVALSLASSWCVVWATMRPNLGAGRAMLERPGRTEKADVSRRRPPDTRQQRPDTVGRTR